nr:unnamed protein product [Callosobruchus analis]
MVTCFPIDYMHAVCLGVTRKLLNTWLSGKLSVRLCSGIVNTTSEHLLSFNKCIPSEINRKPRSLAELRRWKATEFRTFLLYIGPVVLQGVIDTAVYEHFLLLHVAISILISAKHIENIGIQYAQQLLNIFVTHAKKLYGYEFVIYNVHLLYHLSTDVEKYGALYNFAASPFENYLGKLKSLIKSPKKPLEQIMRRLQELFLANDLAEPNKEFSQLLMEHIGGPLLANYGVKKEFKS